MAQAGRVQSQSGVVEYGGPVNDFILTVVIHVADAEVVVPLALVDAVAGRRAVERPALGELAVLPIVGGEPGFGVVAAGHDDAGVHAVQVGDGGQEPVDAIAVAVAPRRDRPARR